MAALDVSEDDRFGAATEGLAYGVDWAEVKGVRHQPPKALSAPAILANQSRDICSLKAWRKNERRCG
jgi:hypothetical protein